jgi:hypothetical protein
MVTLLRRSLKGNRRANIHPICGPHDQSWLAVLIELRRHNTSSLRYGNDFTVISNPGRVSGDMITFTRCHNGIVIVALLLVA